MAKCPKCGSRNTSCLNWLEVIGSNVVGGIAGSVMGAINPSLATPAHIKTSRSICSKKEYICNNCGLKFEKERI